MLLITSNVYAQNIIFKAKVIGIKDGDTITVLKDNKEPTVIRLAEIDCPEYKQPFGNKAKQFTSKQVFGRIVEIEIADIDQYDRYIGKVFYENKYLSAELVKNGFAWVYRRYSNNAELVEMENIAKANRIGLWSESNPIAPWEWRRRK